MAASKAACVIVAPAMRDAAVMRGACVVVEPLRVLRAFDAIFGVQKTRA